MFLGARATPGTASDAGLRKVFVVTRDRRARAHCGQNGYATPGHPLGSNLRPFMCVNVSKSTAGAIAPSPGDEGRESDQMRT